MQDPIVLNERWQVGADGMQWILYRVSEKGGLAPVAYCLTKGGLMASVREGAGEIPQSAWAALEALPEHRRHCPGWAGVDVDKEIARARAQNAAGAAQWQRKTGGRKDRMG